MKIGTGRPVHRRDGPSCPTGQNYGSGQAGPLRLHKSGRPEGTPSRVEKRGRSEVSPIAEGEESHKQLRRRMEQAHPRQPEATETSGPIWCDFPDVDEMVPPSPNARTPLKELTGYQEFLWGEIEN